MPSKAILSSICKTTFHSTAVRRRPHNRLPEIEALEPDPLPGATPLTTLNLLIFSGVIHTSLGASIENSEEPQETAFAATILSYFEFSQGKNHVA